MGKPIIELGYMGLEVSSLAQWERFAHGVLGLGVESVPGRSDARRLRMDDRAHRFLLVEGPADDLAFAGWRAADPAALEELGAQLGREGVAWSWATDEELALRQVERMLHFKDPDGNRHEVFLGLAAASAPFVPDVVTSGFVTGQGGLGHAVFASPNPPAAVDFAKRFLGVAHSDTIEFEPMPGLALEALFFHVNERHHSYAVVPAAPGDPKRLNHFMIETRTMDDVGFARDRCLEAGFEIFMDIGQHPNDHMISFYGRTPSGFFVELGWGGVLIDQTHWHAARYRGISQWGHRPLAAGAAR